MRARVGVGVGVGVRVVARVLLASLRLRREGHVEEVEAVQRARRDDVATAARVAHDGDRLAALDVLGRLLLEVVPEGVLHVLPQDLERRLRAEDLLLRHVEVVDEDHEGLAAGRGEGVL